MSISFRTQFSSKLSGITFLPKLIVALFSCLLMSVSGAAFAKNSSFSETMNGGRVTELKLTIPKDSGSNSSTAIFIRCQNNRTDMRFQFLRDFPSDGKLTYFFPRKLAAPFSIKTTDGRQAIIASPTRFLKDWLSAHRFSLNVDAGDLNGSSEFSLLPFDTEGIYKIAKACNWDHLIPAENDILKNIEKQQKIDAEGEILTPSS